MPMTYDSTAPYPRDLIGYGRHPPHARWPGNARIAVQFTASELATQAVIQPRVQGPGVARRCGLAVRGLRTCSGRL